MTDYCPEGIPDTPLGRYVRLVAPFKTDTNPKARAVKKHPPEVKAKALQMHTDGMRIDEVAKTIGIPTRTVRDWASSAGILKTTRKLHDKEFIAQVVERMRQGEGVRKLEKELGLSRGTIQFWRRYL